MRRLNQEIDRPCHSVSRKRRCATSTRADSVHCVKCTVSEYDPSVCSRNSFERHSQVLDIRRSGTSAYVITRRTCALSYHVVRHVNNHGGSAIEYSRHDPCQLHGGGGWVLLNTLRPSPLMFCWVQKPSYF